MKITISTLTSALLALSSFERKRVVTDVLNALSKADQKDFWEAVTFTVYSRTRWLKIDSWMERTFTRNYALTPYKVSMMALKYFKLDAKMKPLMITLARRVKKRVGYRLRGNNR